jgi:hypothetical protein
MLILVVGVGLLGKVKQAVVDMKHFLGPPTTPSILNTEISKNLLDEFNIQLNESDEGTAGLAQTKTSNARNNMLAQLRKSSELASISKSEILDNALLDMCSNLEDENARLQECVGMFTQLHIRNVDPYY